MLLTLLFSISRENKVYFWKDRRKVKFTVFIAVKDAINAPASSGAKKEKKE